MDDQRERDKRAIAANGGKFPKGVSGNPKGRPKGRKNRITELKQDLEIALRENIHADDVKDIIASMIAEAKAGSIGAASLILNKVLPNATDTEDVQTQKGGFTVIVQNTTQEGHSPAVTIDGEFTTDEDQ